MIFKIVRTTFSALFILISVVSNAQQNEYRSEIGVLGGGSFYLGDANNRLFANNQSAFGLIYRQKIDTRLAVSGNWTQTKVVGSVAGVDFTNPINAVDLYGEFNFLDYDNKIYKPNSRKHSLYMFFGLGSMFIPYTGATTFSLSFPMGLGYKVMLGEKFHLNLIWSNRLSFSDKIEGVEALNNNAGLNGSNILNKDLLSTFSIGITYNILKKECNCLQTNR